MTVCEQHESMVNRQDEDARNITRIFSDLAVISNNLKNISDSVLQHHHEADREGGMRDRVLKMSIAVDGNTTKISTLGRQVWRIGIVGGVIGGLIGKLTPELINAIFKLLAHV